jgi:hypothetical protein
VLRTDNGGKFTATEFAAYCVDDGIQRHNSEPYSPHQNGVVECQNHNVVATTRALLKQRGMLAEFWGEAVLTAIHLLNQLPTKSLKGKTPYEAWHGRTLMVGQLRTFGCLAYVKELNAISKLSDRRTLGMFIGYVEGVKAYHILNLVTQRVRTAQDDIFEEGQGWDWSKETNGSAMACQASSPSTTLSSKDSGEQMTPHQHLGHPPLLPGHLHRCPTPICPLHRQLL